MDASPGGRPQPGRQLRAGVAVPAQEVQGGLGTGAVLLTDYGYPRREYYDPRREDGTLRAFHRHRLVDDVFARVGLQDVTVSVDFTALAEAGTGAGFDFAGYCSQASFLIGNGLAQRLGEAEERAKDDAAKLRLRQEAKQLTLPEAMGERFQAMGFARDVEFGTAFLAGAHFNHFLGGHQHVAKALLHVITHDAVTQRLGHGLLETRIRMYDIPTLHCDLLLNDRW